MPGALPIRQQQAWRYTTIVVREIIFDKLTSDFELLFDFKAACTEVLETSYPETMELKAQAFNMEVVALPGPDLWRVIQQYGSTKFKMHP